MKTFIAIICLFCCKTTFAQLELDTIYLSVSYPWMNTAYRGNTTNNSELLFLKIKDQKKVNLTAPLTLKDAKRMRSIRLIFEKTSSPEIGIKIMLRPLFSGRKGPIKEFDTLFRIKEVTSNKKFVVFRYRTNATTKNFDFAFIDQDRKLYKRSLKKLKTRRIIAEYNFTNNTTIFYRENAKVLIDE